GVLRFGNPAPELSRAVADEGIDLLVLGSHGHGKIGDWLFCETAGTVRHAAQVPCWPSARQIGPRRAIPEAAQKGAPLSGERVVAVRAENFEGPRRGF